MELHFQDTFTKALPADKISENYRRQVVGAAYSWVTPRQPSNPSLIHVSDTLASQLGLNDEDLPSKDFLQIFSGAKVPTGSKPYAMAYGGHQFGHWAGQLGDGRAINLGEIVHDQQRWTLQLKGSGETPYSRSADGLAVLRSSIREHLCSEAMYHLGVPTTRSLSLMLTGDEVLRDVMYDGHPAYEPGAVVCRVAPSFLRFGNYQLFAARRDTALLQKTVDYTIDTFFDIQEKGKGRYLAFFGEVLQRTIDMIISWHRVGFVHGVMNTDNMSILGLTIDYGPYGWVDDYNPGWTPNTTDKGEKRYRFGNQANIGLWNLLQLANALYPLLEESKGLEAILNTYGKKYSRQFHRMMHNKLGLKNINQESVELVNELDKVLQLVETDMTIFYRLLSDINLDDLSTTELLSSLEPAFYNSKELYPGIRESWESWLAKYLALSKTENQNTAERSADMRQYNPKYVLRNYMSQLAIEKAEEGDYSLIYELYEMLKHPYTDQEKYDHWFVKRPDWAKNKIGSSMLSCSS